MITDWEFEVYFNGDEWVCLGRPNQDIEYVVSKYGETPVSVMISAEIAARRHVLDMSDSID